LEIVFRMGFKMVGRTEGIGTNGHDLRVQGVKGSRGQWVKEKIIIVNSQFKLKLLQTSVRIKIEVKIILLITCNLQL
jgi:hypothetical protein